MLKQTINRIGYDDIEVEVQRSAQKLAKSRLEKNKLVPSVFKTRLMQRQNANVLIQPGRILSEAPELMGQRQMVFDGMKQAIDVVGSVFFTPI